MSPYAFILFLCITLPATVLTNDDEVDIIKTLKLAIKDTKETTAKTKANNQKLVEEIANVSNEYKKKIAEYAAAKTSDDVKVQEAMKKVEELQGNLSGLYREEKHLQCVITTAEKLKSKLELGIALLTQDISNYDSRKADNDDDKCYELQKDDFICGVWSPGSAGAAVKNLISASTTLIVSDEASGSNDTDEAANQNQFDDEFAVLKLKLNVALTKQEEAIDKQQELKLKLKQEYKFWGQQYKDAKGELENIAGNLKKAEDLIKSFEEKYKSQQQIIADLQKKIDEESNTIDDLKNKLKELEEKLNTFDKAIQCYKSLEDGILHYDDNELDF